MDIGLFRRVDHTIAFILRDVSGLAVVLSDFGGEVGVDVVEAPGGKRQIAAAVDGGGTVRYAVCCVCRLMAGVQGTAEGHVAFAFDQGVFAVDDRPGAGIECVAGGDYSVGVVGEAVTGQRNIIAVNATMVDQVVDDGQCSQTMAVEQATCLVDDAGGIDADVAACGNRAAVVDVAIRFEHQII